MNKLKLLFLLPIFLLLGGCPFSFVKKEYIPVPVFIAISHPNLPDPVNMREVKWKVLNKQKLQELLAQMGENDELVLYALDTQGYTNLSMNVQEIMALIKQQKEIIIYYREDLPKLIEEQNKKQAETLTGKKEDKKEDK